MSNWRTVHTSMILQEAHLAKNFLESKGIPVILFDEISVQGYVYTAKTGNGIKLKVSDSYFSEAVEVLVEGGYIRKKMKQTDSKVFYLNHCPFCGSEEITNTKELDSVRTIIYKLIGYFFPSIQNTYSCYSCNKEWYYDKNVRK